jgi:hypothetical protein
VKVGFESQKYLYKIKKEKNHYISSGLKDRINKLSPNSASLKKKLAY